MRQHVIDERQEQNTRARVAFLHTNHWLYMIVDMFDLLFYALIKDVFSIIVVKGIQPEVHNNRVIGIVINKNIIIEVIGIRTPF